MSVARSHKTRGFTLVEIMIVILIIGVLLTIAIPSFISGRGRSRQKTCMSNQRIINGAKDQYALENNLSNGDLITSADISPVYIREYPFCPAGGVYTLNPIGTPVTCSENAGPYNHNLP